MTFATFPLRALADNEDPDPDCVTYDEGSIWLPNALSVGNVIEWARPVGDPEPDNYAPGASDADAEQVVASWVEAAIGGDTQHADISVERLLDLAWDVADCLWADACEAAAEDTRHAQAHGYGRI